MAKKSKVVSVRVNPDKLKFLKETGVTLADFVRRSLDVYEEQWRLKKFEDETGLGKALVTVLRIETLEAERQIIEKKLKENHERFLRFYQAYEDADAEEKGKLSPQFLFYGALKEQFKDMLQKNETEMEACQKEYLESLSLEQNVIRC